jgi:hypothetical protein
MDEIEDDDDQECLLDYNYANSKKSKTDDDQVRKPDSSFDFVNP